MPVPGQLQAMRGVLSVLDLDQASQAVLRMRDDVDALVATEVDPREPATQHTFNRLADNLGALSFLIDMLSVQPKMARALFTFDAGTGSLNAVMGRRSQRLSAFGGFDELDRTAPTPLVDQAQTLAHAAASNDISDENLQQDLQRLSQQALLADQRALAQTIGSAQQALASATDDEQRQAVRADLARSVAELAGADTSLEPVLEVPQQPVRHTPAPTPAVIGSTGLEDDAEMREIFVEEAREVVQDATAALKRLGADAQELADLTLIRRAFHTLKGSSRMVGLNELGEAAWACEQLYNVRLADQAHLERDLEAFTADALNYLGAWVEAIAAGRDDGHEPKALSARADALRLGQPVAPVPMPVLCQRLGPNPCLTTPALSASIWTTPLPSQKRTMRASRRQSIRTPTSKARCMAQCPMRRPPAPRCSRACRACRAPTICHWIRRRRARSTMKPASTSSSTSVRPASMPRPRWRCRCCRRWTACRPIRPMPHWSSMWRSTSACRTKKLTTGPRSRPSMSHPPRLHWLTSTWKPVSVTTC